MTLAHHFRGLYTMHTLCIRCVCVQSAVQT